MTISVRLNEEEEKLIQKYVEVNHISISDLIRSAVMEKIEEEYDLESYHKAMKEWKKNPKTYTLEEVKKELDL